MVTNWEPSGASIPNHGKTPTLLHGDVGTGRRKEYHQGKGGGWTALVLEQRGEF